jgi:hypothetical protein
MPVAEIRIIQTPLWHANRTAIVRLFFFFFHFKSINLEKKLFNRIIGFITAALGILMHVIGKDI